MRYTFFEFEQFKGIRKTRLDLTVAEPSARVYTLVGLNESGKTTVLDGIHLFHASGEGADVSPRELSGWVQPDPQDLIPIAERSNFNGEIKISCGVELEADDVEVVRTRLRRATGFRLSQLSERFVITDRYRYSNSQFQGRRATWTGLAGDGKTKSGKVVRPVGGDVWNELTSFIRRRLPVVWYFPNFLFEFPERIYLEPDEDEKPESRYYRELFQDILDALDAGLSIDTHIVARYRSGKEADADNLRQVLLAAGRHVTATVVAEWNKIFAKKPIDAKNVRIDVGDEPRPDGTTRVYVEFRLEDTDGFFLLGQKSLGFRWFFIYLLLTTYRGAEKATSRISCSCSTSPRRTCIQVRRQRCWPALPSFRHKRS